MAPTSNGIRHSSLRGRNEGKLGYNGAVCGRRAEAPRLPPAESALWLVRVGQWLRYSAISVAITSCELSIRGRASGGISTIK